MGKSVDMNLARGLLLFGGALILAFLLHHLAKQEEEGVVFLVLAGAVIVLGTPLLCLSVQPKEGRGSFTPLLLGLGLAAALASIVFAAVVGYYFSDVGHHAATFVGFLFIFPAMFWKNT